MSESKSQRDRQPNWTIKEELAFVEAYIAKAHILESEYSGPGSGGVSSSTKDDAWREILQKVNSLSIYNRKLDYVKKKWAQLKCLALRKNRENLTKTGGGRGAVLSDAETVVLNFLVKKKSSQISGICGGSEIFTPSPSTSAATLVESTKSTSQSASAVLEETESIFEDYVDNLEDDSTELDISTELVRKEVVTEKENIPTGRTVKPPSSINLNKQWMTEEIDLIKLKKRKTELEIKLLEKKLKL